MVIRDLSKIGRLPIRVIHVVKEVEHDILQQIGRDEPKNDIFSKAKTLISVAKKDADSEDHLRWSYCLTSLVGYLYDLCPNALHFASVTLSRKVSETQNDIERAPNPFQNTDLAQKAWDDVCILFFCAFTK